MQAAMLFPGQGSQFVGMGKDYYDDYPVARELYKKASVRLGFDIAELSFSGDLEELTQTRNAQPAVLLHSIVTLAVLKERGIEPSVVAGHSLGEFSALAAAGFFDPIDALAVVRRRGELMYEAGLQRPGTMAAVIGADVATIEGCLHGVRKHGEVVIANYNSPIQYAISGEVAAVEKAVEACKSVGAKRTMMLTVSGAFHSPLMAPIVPEFRAFMETIEFGDLRVPWVANVTGELVGESHRVLDLLARQLSSPVLWIDSMRTFARHAGGPVFEVGPGKVLAGLMKRNVDAVEVASLSSAADLETALA